MCNRRNEQSTQVRCPDRLTHSAAPAEKPLFVFDADCDFCIRWIRRWQETTREKIDVASFQSVGERFAQDIQIECFSTAVHLIETDGTIHSGAEAVFRMLSYGSRTGSGFGLWCYDHVPGLAGAARYGYRFVAGRRALASTLTKALWGTLIALTGNYYFFNLLAAALCLLAVDDAVIPAAIVASCDRNFLADQGIVRGDR